MKHVNLLYVTNKAMINIIFKPNPYTWLFYIFIKIKSETKWKKTKLVSHHWYQTVPRPPWTLLLIFCSPWPARSCWTLIEPWRLSPLWMKMSGSWTWAWKSSSTRPFVWKHHHKQRFYSIYLLNCISSAIGFLPLPW